jgi:hypothetical protein
MSSLSFQPMQDGLYSAASNGTQTVSAYWLLLSGTPPSGNLDAATTWNYSGCYIFIPSNKPIQDVGSFTTTMQGQCSPPNDNTRWLSWISDPAGVPNTIVGLVNANILSGTQQAQTIQPLLLPIANLGLNVPSLSTLDFEAAPAVSPDTPALVFNNNASSGNLIQLQRNGNAQNTNVSDGVAVPLSGDLTGVLLFDALWDRGDFYTLLMDNPMSFDATLNSSEIRYFYGETGNVQALHYPVFPPEPQSQDPTKQLALIVSLDPLNAWDYNRTRFGLDVGKFDSMSLELPTANFFSSTDGHSMNLVPQQNAGYALGVRPPVTNEPSSDAYAYLTPVGLFNIAPPQSASAGLAGADPTTIRHLMCGMTGTEYLIAAPGATVEFVPGASAYTKGFTMSSSASLTAEDGACQPLSDPCNPGGGGTPIDPSDLMTGDFTTSWVRINPAQSLTESTDPLVDYGYAVQPEASVYYSTVQKPKSSNDNGTPYTYPLALGCRVSILEENGETARLPVPMAPYGGVWLTQAPNLPPADSLTVYESQIIGTARHATAPKDMTNGPTFFDPVTHAGIAGGFAKTPEGLLLELNDSPHPGTINTLFLAKSPNNAPIAGAAQLAFQGVSPSTVVSPALSNALMNDKLFMVVTNYEDQNTPPNPIPNNPLGTFDNEIQMGEWTFRLDVGYTEDQTKLPRTILIFKFTTALSVVDLVANAAYWQEWQTFISNDSNAPAMIKIIQSQLNEYLCVANPSSPNYGGQYFEDFWSKVSCPDWTGILAINCGLDAGDLPPDLQDLLGGISGELRAHHFGVTVNQIAGQDSSEWDIDQSSLFALVHYEKDYQAPTTEFGFQVLRLNALFENSTLTHFDSRIAVTIPKLFGEKVMLHDSSVQGANVLEIEGVYQKHGDSGTVVFDTKTPQVFSFTDTTQKFRAIQEMYVTDAALVAVSSTKDENTKTITVVSNLAVSGMLMFAGDVDPKKSGLDLFAYGDASANPPTGLGFTAYNIGMTTAIKNNIGTITSIGPDLTTFRITPATSTYRPGSIVSALPLKLNEFVQKPSSAGWEVTFLGESSNDFAADYALSFQVSLGSLGALSAVADSLDVDLVLGWNIAGSDTVDNQLWLLMVPPKSMQGQLGFGLQGVLDTTFTGVKLVSQPWTSTACPNVKNVYGIYFLNVQIQLLGLPLIPGASNFTLFADPCQGNTSNMGWLMTLKAPAV